MVSAPHWGRWVRLSKVLVLLQGLATCRTLCLFLTLRNLSRISVDSRRSQFNPRDVVRKCRRPFPKDPKLFSSYCFPLQTLLSFYLLGLKPGSYLCFLSSFSSSFFFPRNCQSLFSFPQGLGFETQKLGRGSFKICFLL